MRRRPYPLRPRWPALLTLAALTGLLGLGAATPAHAAPPAPQEELYLGAMRALSEGRPDEATEQLMRFLENEPQHAGAWLDLAISQCELGRAAEAERLFRDIEQRFAPPPGIAEVIRDQRARGCNRLQPKRDLMGLTLGRGYDSNVNQGSSQRYFSTGSGNSLTEWELAPDYLPQPDEYTVLSGDYAHTFNQNGTLGYAQLRVRRHDSSRQQDSATLLLGIEQPWRLGKWRGSGALAVGVVQLDNQLYQRQSQMQWRVTPPLPLPERVDLALTAAVSHVSYPTRNRYDSNTVELGGTLNYRGVARQGNLALGALKDHGQRGRLGGDRQGWYASTMLHSRLGEYLSGEIGLSHQNWRSDSVYSPGLIEVMRHQNTNQLRATLFIPLRPHHSLQLEWRAVRNKENISLFQYNSRLVQLNWRWDNF